MKFVKYSREYACLADGFSCGNIVIDRFLKNTDVGGALDKNEGITYILLSDDEDFIVGYYNISAGRIDMVEETGESHVYIPMGGTVNINYLAVAESLQHTRIVDNKKYYYGDYILRDCEKKILSIRENLGIAFVTLYSTEDGYHMYHDRNGYIDFDEDMSTFTKESDDSCYKLYKWADEIITFAVD